MAFIEWRAEFAVGIGRVDEQHQGLVRLVDELYQAIAEVRGHEALAGVLTGLMDYAQVHFATEEDLMAAHAYPELAEHRAKHQEFAARVAQFGQRFNEGQDNILLELARFLKDWLADHMLTMDKKFGPYLRERGVV